MAALIKRLKELLRTGVSIPASLILLPRLGLLLPKTIPNYLLAFSLTRFRYQFARSTHFRYQYWLLIKALLNSGSAASL